MKTRTFIFAAVLLVSVSLSRADIIGYSIADDGDGVITCTNYDGLITLGPASYQINLYGDHNIFEAGHIAGYFTTDTETDPTIAFYQSIDNDTAFAWSGYLVTVTMNKSFSFSNVGVVNSGWTYAPPTVTQIGSDWIGSIQYSAGVPVQVGASLNFNYAVTFIGSASFAEELTPTPVPEPGTFALAACGLAGLLVMRRRSAS
jgi:hypothetical protein